ncbi:hypothetical protein TNCV_2078891 [Trichonephila clavipes]|nr:hypothetical protein TNCV_2078891 [Trichonephila clavipes]
MAFEYRNGCVRVLNTQIRSPTTGGLNQQRTILSVFWNLMSIYSITHRRVFLSGRAFVMGTLPDSCSSPLALFFPIVLPDFVGLPLLKVPTSSGIRFEACEVFFAVLQGKVTVFEYPLSEY